MVGSGANTITTASGDDYIVVGGGLNVINDGTGADVIKFTTVPAYGNVYTTITGASGDKLDVSGIIQGAVSTTVTAAIVLGSTAAFGDYLNAAASGTAPGVITSFVWSGDTYIVIDSSASTNFVNLTDAVIHLTGVQTISAIGSLGSATGVITIA